MAKIKDGLKTWALPQDLIMMDQDDEIPQLRERRGQGSAQ